MAKLNKLRSAVKTLGQSARDSVAVIRDAFVSNVPPIQTVNSSSVADFIARTGGAVDSFALVSTTARIGLKSSVVGSIASPPQPRLDSVEVSLDGRANGTIDAASCRIVFSNQIGSAPISRFEIYRIDLGQIDGLRPLKISGVSLYLNASVRKNNDPYAVAAMRSAELGGLNEISSTTADDAYSSQRAKIEPIAPKNVRRTTLLTNRQVSSGRLLTVDNLQPDVASDIPTFVNKRMTSGQQKLVQPLQLGKNSDLNVLSGRSLSTEIGIVEQRNQLNARKIATVSSSGRSRTIGSFVEYDFSDVTVSFGNRYVYYVVAVDAASTRSTRSRLVTVDVTRRTAVKPPVVSYSVVWPHVRFSVVGAPGDDLIEIWRRVGPALSHHKDIKLGPDGSTTYVDMRTVVGNIYEYRFYAVDPFGLKSSFPTVVTVEMPEYGSHRRPKRPTMVVEQLSGRAIRVRVSCDDPTVSFAFVGRIDQTIGEISFKCPNDFHRSSFGQPNAKNNFSRHAPHLSSDVSWNGALALSSGSAVLVDRTVAWDRTYKYSCFVVDDHGVSSDHAVSEQVVVSTRPIIDPPTNLSALYDGGKVVVSWAPSTNDFLVEDMLGDQDALAATAVRSAFQVERRRLDSQSWDVMPPTTGTSFIDPVDEEVSPFRPPAAISHAEYQYRVIAMQSGGFLSTYTEPINLFVGSPLTSIDGIWARSLAAVDPPTIVVSWTHAAAAVDSWEVERAAVNKFRGSRIVSVEQDDVANLAYTRLGKITREASRGLSREADRDLVNDRDVYVGSRWFVDDDVDRSNTYIYRMRPLTSSGTGPDAWSYVGFKFTDRYHDGKLNSIISDDTRRSLVTDDRPFVKGKFGRTV